MKIRRIRELHSNIKVIETKKDEKKSVSEKNVKKENIKVNLLEKISSEDELKEENFETGKSKKFPGLFLEERDFPIGSLEEIRLSKNFSTEGASLRKSEENAPVYEITRGQENRNVYLNLQDNKREKAYDIEPKIRVIERKTDRGLSFPFTPLFREASLDRENLSFQNLPIRDQQDTSPERKEYNVETKSELKTRRRMPWD